MNKLLTTMKSDGPGETPVHERDDFNYIVFGGSILSLCAGFVNVIYMNHVLLTVSHNTGVTSRMAINLGKLNISEAGFGALVLFFFFLGSTTVGYFQKKSKFYYSRKYGFFLMGESLMLILAVYLFHVENVTIPCFIASYSMGLQNGLFTNFSGAVVRTTHVTGLLTDVGLIIGHRLRGIEKSSDIWRLKVMIPLFIGFVSGGILSQICYTMWTFYSLAIPIFIYFIGGLIWSVWRLSYQGFEKAAQMKALELSENINV